jgi:hypothetical protein
VHQPPDRPTIRGKLRCDIGQQPLPLEEPIGQIGTRIWEAKLRHPRGDPLLGMAASLPRQPLSPGWQGDAQRCQRLGDGPLGLATFSGEPRDALAAVAAGLQVATQVDEPELADASLQPPDTTVVDDKPALDDQLTCRFCWSRCYPCFGLSLLQ